MPRDTKSYEGFSGSVYKDTEGFDTIGYGHKLTPDDVKTGRFTKGLTEQQATALYNKDRAAHDEKFYDKNPQYRDAPENVKTALEDMAYNMGPSFLKEFPKAAAHLASGNYKGAGKEFTDSEYYKQVGQRAADNVNLISTAYAEPVTPFEPTNGTGLVPQPEKIANLFAGLGEIKRPDPVLNKVAKFNEDYDGNNTTLSGLGGFSGFN